MKGKKHSREQIIKKLREFAWNYLGFACFSLSRHCRVATAFHAPQIEKLPPVSPTRRCALVGEVRAR